MSMTITTFDRASGKLLAEESEAVLRAVAERHGLTIVRAGGSLDGPEAVLKFRFASTVGPSKAELDFAKYAEGSGWSPATWA
jgi:hypothetical protein